jgi:hypothetical protein
VSIVLLSSPLNCAPYDFTRRSIACFFTFGLADVASASATPFDSVASAASFSSSVIEACDCAPVTRFMLCRSFSGRFNARATETPIDE